ncbi:FAD-dependent 5-carboxymethylaminomethyl-2-thiouridine(34) oxidoreductase MnmC [Parapusillimonas sp. SGNA-6]|nr:FAD-dependent 5-carboxymethylaminomethyl-2-thiouridine(34) oxidoreductase MnmC [Parapusillimonas sp. SGNA-6]
MPLDREPLSPARLAFNEQGVPMSLEFGDIYHPQRGALDQARHVFLRGNGLPQRWQNRKAFTVGETGFGLGHNFLATWQAWRADPMRSARLHFVSFEAHPFTREDMAALLLRSRVEPEAGLAAQLVGAWPPLLPGMHRLEFANGCVTLTLALGPIARMARQVEAHVDAWFLDGFAPRVNPDMWTRSLFGQLARMATPGATVATWCCAGEVRRNLRDAGFVVSKVPGFADKREMTQGYLRPGMGHEGQSTASSRVLVVGGGFAGAGVAHSLAARGKEVAVFDPVFEHGLAASHDGHLAAGMTPWLSRDDDVRSRLTRAGVWRAMQRWKDLGPEAAPRRCGTVQLVGEDEAAAWQQALSELGFPATWVRWMTQDEASETAGIRLSSGGLWLADGHLVRPQPLLRALLGHPAIACHAQRVQALRARAGGGWTALDADGRSLADAEEVVLANADQASRLLQGDGAVKVPPKMAAMHRLAGQVAYYPAMPEWSGRCVVAGEGYWLPEVDGRCVGGSTYEAGPGHSAVTVQGRRAIHDKLAAVLEDDVALDRAPASAPTGWAGWRAAVKDRLPVIGCIDAPQRLWLATGYGSRGLSWSGLAGDIIAATLDNEPVPLERELLRKIAPR